MWVIFAAKGSIAMSDNKIAVMTTYTSQLEGMAHCSNCMEAGTHMARMSGIL